MSKKGNDDVASNSLKFEKSVTRMSQRGSYAKIRSHERLAGGADAKSKSSVSVNKSGINSTAKVTPVISETLRNASEAEVEIEAILAETSSQAGEKTAGDKSVNEMIDYVIQNLHEAGKALASLGENFEHDLKLMFVEVMGKVQNWVSLAQIRLDAAKTDLNSLLKELVSRSHELESRDREIAELKKKVTDSESTRIAYEKILAEKAQVGGQIQSQQMPTGITSAQAGDLTSQDPGALPGSQTKSGTQAPFAVGSQSGTPSGIPAGISAGPQSGAPSGISAGPQSGAPSGISAGPQSGTPSSVPIAGGPLSSQGIASAHDEISGGPGYTAFQAAGISGVGISGRPGDPTSRGVRYREEDEPITADVAVQSGKNRDKAKRESELESELSRLRKENEKIMKERTEYENAIQRALLRGVSSLNAETLRVLRCSPVACYTPCGPPPSAVNTVETMIPCVSKRTRDNWTPRGCRTTTNDLSSRFSSSNRTRSNVGSVPPEQEFNCCGVNKKSSTGTYGSFTRCKRSPVTSDPSMVFLLHQADTSKICVSGNQPQKRPCARAKSKKVEASVCVKKLG